MRVDALDQLGPVIVVLGVGAWVAWLAVGTLVNRRRAAALSRWTYTQARALGDEVYIRWITLAAFEMTVPQPRPPFRHLTFVGFLESREMPFVWLTNRLRGRSDLLVVRAELAVVPRWGGMEAFRPHSVLAGDARAAASRAGWPTTRSAEGLVRAHAPATAPRAERLLAAVGPYAPYLERLALRREAPQLQLTLAIGRLRLDAAPPLAPVLCQLAEAS